MCSPAISGAAPRLWRGVAVPASLLMQHSSQRTSGYVSLLQPACLTTFPLLLSRFLFKSHRPAVASHP